LATITHNSEGEIKVLALHADPITLTFSELSFLLLDSSFDHLRLIKSLWEEIVWNLLILREVSWERLGRVSTVETLLLELIQIIPSLVLEVIIITKIVVIVVE